MGKRQASGAAAAAAKKPPTDIELVAAILTEFETSTGFAKAILAKGLPKASGLEPTDEQEQACEQISEALKAARQQVLDKQGSHDLQLQEVHASIAALEAAAEEVGREVVKKQQAIAAQEEALHEAQSSHSEVQAEHAKAEKSGKAFKSKGAKLRQETSKFAAIVDALTALLHGSSSEGVVKSIIAGLQECSPEQALLAAAPCALALTPEARGPFDKLTLELVQEVLTTKLQELQKEIADREPEEAHQQAELLGLWALSDIEHAKLEALKHSLEKAKAEAEETKKASTQSRNKVLQQQKSLNAILVQKTLDEAKVAEIDQVAEIFQRLAAAEVVLPGQDVNMEAPDVHGDQATMDVDETVAKETESAISKSAGVSHGNALHVPTPMVA